MVHNFRRRLLGLVFALVGLCVGLWARAGDSTTQKAHGPNLIDAMLSAVRQPAPEQFPTPESVVRFFLLQVQNQDLDEATRAFPIVESYRNVDFLTTTKYVGALDVHGVLPDSPYHNVQYAFQPLALFDKVSLRLTPLADGDLPDSTDGMTDEQINKIASRFDRSRLANLKILSVKTGRSAPLVDALAHALGETEACSADATVQTGVAPVKFTFMVRKMAGNWRISNILP